MGFLEKLEHTLAASQIDKREGLEWFRFAVQGGLPHGPPLEQILADLEDLSYRTPDAGHQILDAGVIPADVYYSVAMGSDIGHMPVQTLVDFDGLPHCLPNPPPFAKGTTSLSRVRREASCRLFWEWWCNALVRRWKLGTAQVEVCF